MRVATDNASVNSIFYALLSVIKHRNLSNTHNAHKNTRLITSIEEKKITHNMGSQAAHKHKRLRGRFR